MSDPKRLLDEGVDEPLRGALDAGRRELPSAERLEAILARLPPGPTGGGGGGAAKPMGGLAKVAMGLAAAALVGGAALLLMPPREAAVAPRLVTAATTSASVALPPPPVETSSPAPTAVLAPAPSHAASAGHAAAVAPPPDPALEVSLLQDAHDALAASPETALARCAEQERLFPKSTVAQEREVIAIDALLRLHRDTEARGRAAAFAAHFPGSASQRRVDALLGQ